MNLKHPPFGIGNEFKAPSLWEREGWGGFEEAQMNINKTKRHI